MTNLRRIRTERGINVLSATAELGIDPQKWWRWERGSKMRLDDAECVARFLGVTLDELAGRTPPASEAV